MSLLLDALKRAEDAKRAKKSDPTHLETSAADAAAVQSHTQAELLLENAHQTAARPQAPISPGDSQPDTMSGDAPVLTRADTLSLVDDAPPAIAMSGAPATALPNSANERSNKSAIDRIIANQATASRSRQTAQADWSAEELADLSAERESMQRDVAKNVFAAKQNSKKISAPSRPAKWLLPVIAFVLVGVGVGGWYVWNQVAASSRSAFMPTASRPANTSANAITPPATLRGSTAAGKPADNAAVVIAAEQALPPLLPPPAKEIPLPKLASTKPVVMGQALTERELLAKRLMASNANNSAKEAPVSLKLSQTIQPPKINPALLAGYAALGRGDYAQAKQRYTEVAQAEPFNMDAQLGLATAAARTGDNAAAARHYRRVLEMDPRNSSAISGLLAVSGDVKPEALEAELKTLLLKTPDSASLQFSLGNLYAGQKRWTEAQQAYFEAYRIDSNSADYLYNLAVSLDQLNQSKLALDYYQKALVQSGKTGGQFDRASVQRRIGELKIVAQTG